MSATTFLTDVELAELTECTQSAAQRRWLDGNHWPYELSARGRPRVLRKFMEKKLGLAEQLQKRGSQPDRSALEKLMGSHHGKKKAS